MRPHKLNKKTLPGFVEKNVCKVQKNTQQTRDAVPRCGGVVIILA